MQSTVLFIIGRKITKIKALLIATINLSSTGNCMWIIVTALSK